MPPYIGVADHSQPSGTAALCCSVSSCNIMMPASTPTTANRWKQLRDMVFALTGLDTDAEKTRWRRRKQPSAAVTSPLLLLHHDFWLEALDPKHRYGFHLRVFHDHWKNEMQDPLNIQTELDRSFFYWLDHGRGSQLELPECSRGQLNATCVRYCSPHQRYSFEVYFQQSTPKSRLCFASSHAVVETDALSKWIFVLSRDNKLYVARKNKGFFHHSSFLAGAPIVAAGKIFVTGGVIHAVEPHSGHFKPRLESLTALCRMLLDNGVDMNLVHVIRPRKWKDPWPFLSSASEDDCVQAGQSDSEYS